MKKVLLILTMCFFSQKGLAISNNDFLHLSSDNSTTGSNDIATIYVHGVTMGYVVARIMGTDNSICLPPMLSIGEINFRSLVKSEMDADKTVGGQYPVAMTIFRALKKRFPCK